MGETMVKKPITSTLRGMSVGDKVEFPMDQTESINVCRGRLQRKLRKEEAKWSYECFPERDVVIVTRTA